MKISDLMSHLQSLQSAYGDLEIVGDRFSDYERLEIENVSIVEAAHMRGCAWLMRAHPTMPNAPIRFVHFSG